MLAELPTLDVNLSDWSNDSELRDSPRGFQEEFVNFVKRLPQNRGRRRQIYVSGHHGFADSARNTRSHRRARPSIAIHSCPTRSTRAISMTYANVSVATCASRRPHHDADSVYQNPTMERNGVKDGTLSGSHRRQATTVFSLSAQSCGSNAPCPRPSRLFGPYR